MDDSQRRFQAFERDGWNQVARDYAELTKTISRQVADPLLDAAAVGAGSTVVDVATGPGWTASVAAERGAEPIGVDISETMIDEARTRFPDLAFEAGSAERLPLEDSSVDAVVSAFGMPHFADHEAFAAEAHRVLRAGGRLAFASWHPPGNNPFFAIALGSIARAGNLDIDLPEGVDMFTWAEDGPCQELLSGAGFGELSRVDVPMQFVTDQGGAAIVHFLENASVRSRALYQAQTPEAKQAISETIDEMMAPLESGGSWTVPLNAFVVSAAHT